MDDVCAEAKKTKALNFRITKGRLSRTLRLLMCGADSTYVLYDTAVTNAKEYDGFSLSFYKECEVQCCSTNITDLTCAQTNDEEDSALQTTTHTATQGCTYYIP
jgi:hypothetical protein